MKIILSRKGFDSSSGGKPSPILNDGTMLSLPIPWGWSGVNYKDLYFTLEEQTYTYRKIMEDLGVRKYSECHLDPDIVNNRQAKSWVPAFGQVGASAKELENLGVKSGDLFVFFGWFKKVNYSGDQFTYAMNEMDMHAAWGYLQIDQVYSATDILNGNLPSELSSHPHAALDYFTNNKNNVIYSARKELIFHKGVSGYGTFRWNGAQRLSSEHKSGIAKWDPIPGLKPMSNRIKVMENGPWNSGGRGQEFVCSIENKADFFSWFERLRSKR